VLENEIYRDIIKLNIRRTKMATAKKTGHPKEDYQVDKSTDAYKKSAGQLRTKKERKGDKK